MDESAVAVLKARAAVLARRTSVQARDEERDHVVFRLEKIRFAVCLAAVLEVFTPRQVTPLPGWAHGNAGLTAWRGDLLLILDVRELLAVAAAPNTNIDRTIVMRANAVTAGVIVDEIMGIEEIDEKTLEPLPERLSSIGSGIVTGITDRSVIVLDPAALLQHHGRGG
ncbi:MAG: chemotaxis protein CheW [Longimicrobiales bacterium]